MSTTWLSNVYNFDVEQREIPRAAGKAYIPMGQTQIGVLHTTEGFSVDSAWNTLKNHPGGPAAPHFVIGENRIVQCRPIGVQSAALSHPSNLIRVNGARADQSACNQQRSGV